jgi:hypothetical protein
MFSFTISVQPRIQEPVAMLMNVKAAVLPKPPVREECQRNHHIHHRLRE